MLTKFEVNRLKFLLDGYIDGNIYEQALREVQKPFTRVYIFRRDNDIVKIGEQVGARYLEAIYGKKQHGYGPPHPHMFVACLEELMERITINDTARKVLTAYCSWANSDRATAVKLSQHIRKFTISGAHEYGGARVKMELSNHRPPIIMHGTQKVHIARFNRILACSLENAGGVVEGELTELCEDDLQ